MADVLAWLERWESVPWVITLLAVVLAFALGRLIVRIARPVALRITGHTSSDWDDRLVHLMSSPLGLVLSLLALRFALPWLPLDVRGAHIFDQTTSIMTTFAVLWMAFRVIDLARAVLERRAWAVDRPSSRSLLSIGARFVKVAAVALAGIVGLAQLGVSVASLIAGLGIGGLAVALAAQKTLENLFGTLSIGVDQPMREGDFVKLYDIVGTVEQIGLRSTRIRTLDRTVVTIPNGELANQRIESFTARDRLRLAMTVGLVYDTSVAQMRAILAEFEAILRRHPKIWPDAVVVRFKEFGASSLDIEVMAWFLTSDWSEFQVIRQDVLLDFMAAVERNGSSFAFPSRSLYFANSPAPAGPPSVTGR